MMFTVFDVLCPLAISRFLFIGTNLITFAVQIDITFGLDGARINSPVRGKPPGIAAASSATVEIQRTARPCRKVGGGLKIHSCKALMNRLIRNPDRVR